MTGFTGLNALINGRVYRMIAPQGVTVPFITYQRSSTFRENGMGKRIGIVEARYQLHIISSTYEIGRVITDQVCLCFDQWRSTSTDPVVLETTVQNDYDTFDDDTDLFHGIVEILIFFREA